MYKALILCLAIILDISCIFAHVDGYTFSCEISTYTPITDGTILGSASNDENSFNEIPIGFDFLFDFYFYNVISVNTNGFIVFGPTAQNSSMAISNPNANASNNVIAALNRDLKSKPTGSLTYKLFGVPPYRIFVVQWDDYQRYSSSNTGDTLCFQIRLHEVTNTIEIQYGHIVFGNSNLVQRNFQVGLRGNSSTEFNNRKIIIGSNTWLTSIYGTLNTDHCEMSPSLVPPLGLTYEFYTQINDIPLPAELVSPMNDAEDIPISTSLNWASPHYFPTGYLVYFGTDNPPTNIINGLDVGCVSSYPASELSFSTNYYWKIVPYNPICQAVLCPIWSFTTQAYPIHIDIYNNQVLLSWSAVPNAVNYKIEGSDQINTGFTDITSTGSMDANGRIVTWITDLSLPFHFYRMKSLSN